MDEITLLRVIATVASFVTFIVIWAWDWKRSNRALECSAPCPSKAWGSSSTRPES